MIILNAQTENTVYVELTRDDCRNLADFIEMNLIREIREDENLDNIKWIESMIHAMHLFEDAKQR